MACGKAALWDLVLGSRAEDSLHDLGRALSSSGFHFPVVLIAVESTAQEADLSVSEGPHGCFL